MKHAILILAHNKPLQIRNLIDALGSEYFDFYIHVDKKAPVSPFINSLQDYCHFVPDDKRVKVYLNDFSLVDATCSLLKEASETNKYQYFILLTGQDYPIKSNKYINDYLVNSYPNLYIDSYGVDEARKRGVTWVEHVGHRQFSQRFRRTILNFVGGGWYFSPYGKILKFFPNVYDRLKTIVKGSPRKELSNTTNYKYSVGSHFWMLPDVAVQYILERYENDEILNGIFRHTAAPEESYFQTVLSTISSEYKTPNPWGQFVSKESEMDNPALRLIKWYENGVHTNGHPAVWKVEDYDFIRNAKALFARKFDSSIDNEIIKSINQSLLK